MVSGFNNSSDVRGGRNDGGFFQFKPLMLWKVGQKNSLTQGYSTAKGRQDQNRAFWVPLQCSDQTRHLSIQKLALTLERQCRWSG